MSIGNIKEELHRLVDALPEEEAPAARRFLQWLVAEEGDPVIKSLLLAPEEDEEITAEEEAAVQEAREQVARGELIPDEEVWRRLGHAR